jgi:PIN domain nuclease of toxin-antitoxin system
MKNILVFDACALIAYLEKEEGFDKVKTCIWYGLDNMEKKLL